MPYSFDIESILDYLNKNRQNGGEQLQSGADIVNEAIKPAVLGATQQQEQSALDPTARQLVSQIIGLKELYGNADALRTPNMSADQIRGQAQAQANDLRQVADSAGWDLSGYGAGVSLQDARRNLMTNDARAAVEMAQGKFALNSDQYYTQKYDEFRQQGMTVGESKRAAAYAAKRYKLDRMQYLNGMYYGYGLGDDPALAVSTPIGDRLIREIAAEGDTATANFYANRYPSAKDTYKQAQDIAQMTLANQFARENQAAQHRNTMEGKFIDDSISRSRAAYDDVRNRYNATWQQGQAEQAEEAQFNKMLNRTISTLQAAGFNGEEIKDAIGQTFGIKRGTAKPDNSKIDNLMKIYQEKQKQLKSITDALNSTTPLPDDTQKVLMAQAAEAQEDLKALGGVLLGISGVGGLNQGNSQEGQQAGEAVLPDYKVNDPESNRRAIGILIPQLIAANATDEQAAQALREWMAAGGNDQVAEPIIREFIQEYHKAKEGDKKK